MDGFEKMNRSINLLAYNGCDDFVFIMNEFYGGPEVQIINTKTYIYIYVRIQNKIPETKALDGRNTFQKSK